MSALRVGQRGVPDRGACAGGTVEMLGMPAAIYRDSGNGVRRQPRAARHVAARGETGLRRGSRSAATVAGAWTWELPHRVEAGASDSPGGGCGGFIRSAIDALGRFSEGELRLDALERFAKELDGKRKG